MKFWCGVGNRNDLEAWAESELRENENPHPDVCELFGISDEKSEKYLLRISKDINGFEPVSDEGEKLAIIILNEYCQKFIDQEITPYKFCRLVQRLDAAFVDFRELSDNEFEYPPWLGDLWNCCDWCDGSWTNDNSPHLVKEAKVVLINNKSDD